MSNVILAFKTLWAMDECIRKDQGNEYRENLRKVLPHIGDAYRTDDDAFRSHLGASIIGQECARSVWYSWRWATRKAFSGQMLRLFNRGHLEEGRFIALLLTIGCEIVQQDKEGKQFRISHADGHMGGSGDGVIIHLPDLDQDRPALGEFKTHNEKSFNKLAGDNWRNYLDYTFGKNPRKEVFIGDGVKEAKPEHYTQMQIYMIKMGLSVCLYVAVNKNTDDIYCELVPLNPNHAEQFLDRGSQLVDLVQPPKKLSNSPGFFKCKFCDHIGVCHLGEVAEKNCRTCAFSRPLREQEGGKWYCTMNEKEIDKARQLTGCDHYTVKPGI